MILVAVVVCGLFKVSSVIVSIPLSFGPLPPQSLPKNSVSMFVYLIYLCIHCVSILAVLYTALPGNSKEKQQYIAFFKIQWLKSVQFLKVQSATLVQNAIQLYPNTGQNILLDPRNHHAKFECSILRGVKMHRRQTRSFLHPTLIKFGERISNANFRMVCQFTERYMHISSMHISIQASFCGF